MAVPAMVFELIRVCAMVSPEPKVAPVTPASLAVQLNVLPGTLLVKISEVVPPEQNTCVGGVAVATGIG